MACSLFIVPFTTTPNCNSVPCSKTHRIDNHSTFNFRVSSRPTRSFKGRRLRFATKNQRSHSDSNSLPSDDEEEKEEEEEGLVEDLRVPEHWVDPSKALEESEWLRVTLHKWLDDEYCQEETNVDISNVAAHSYYESLVEKQTDLGEILLNMARELESISYQESFHGAFSSANAAINLIIHRIEQE